MTTYGIAVNSLNASRHTGVERYLAELLRAMMRTPLNADERVVLYAAAVPKGFAQLPQGWEWRILPFQKGWTHVRLAWELFRHPPDVFFNPTHEVPRGIRRKTRVVTTVHDLAFARFPGLYPRTAMRRQAWALRRAVARSSTLLAISDTTRRDLVERYHVPEERIAVAPLGVHASQFAGAASEDVLRRYRLTPGGYVLYVGRLEGKKNVATLVRGFGELRRSCSMPVELALVGGWGFGKERIARALEEVGESARLLGYVADEDLPHVYRGALAFCFPSYYEGFGLPVLEAFAAGVPVIASTAPALVEVAGDAARYASPDDAHAWCEALRELIEHPEERARLAAFGHAAVSRYTWDATASKTWDALRGV